MPTMTSVTNVPPQPEDSGLEEAAKVQECKQGRKDDCQHANEGKSGKLDESGLHEA